MIAVLIVLSLIFIIKYRIKSVIREVVRRETKGVYKLDFSKISIDFLKGKVKLNAVDFKPVSPDMKDYRFTISHLYFSLDSWNQLFFHRKLFVDSLQINAPEITIYQQPALKNKSGLGPIQEIFRSLQNISDIFKVHVLEINRGNMTIYRETNNAPIVIRDINFRVENFGQKKNENTHLRFSDNITLRIGKQNWIFPSRQIVKFSNLYFSGKDQTFQVDSCSINMAPDNWGRRTSLFAVTLLFRIDELTSVFDRNELNIDTLYCKSPVLSVAMRAGKKDKDTVSDLNESIHQLPGNINIRFINIENGQIHLASSDNNRSYTGKKTNLKIYGLSIGHNPGPVIHTGRIDLNLHEISFATRDSLYLLTVNEFRFDSNNLVCRNAYLKPSVRAKGYLKAITLPAFTLVDISLNDLLEKRLKAQVAIIEKPQFFFAAGATRKKAVEFGIPVNKFYNTIKDLAQLIDVRWLTIKDGTLSYIPRGSSSPELSLRNIDVEINLVGMLNSSSIGETRQTIHALSIGSINLEKDNIRAGLTNFFINASREIGKLGSLAVQLKDGTQFNAANLYWEGFSWENFIKNKRITVDTLNVPSLTLMALLTPGQSQGTRSGLQPLTINKLTIGKAVVNVRSADNEEVGATVNRVALDGLRTSGNLFFWQKLSGRVDSLYLKDESRQLTIQQLNILDYGESVVQNILYSDGINQVKIPRMKFQLQLNNSHLAACRFPTLDIFDGRLYYQQTGEWENLSARFDVHLQAARLENGSKALVADNFFLKVDSLTADKPMRYGAVAVRDLCGSIRDYPLMVYFNKGNAHLKKVIDNLHITGGRLSYNDSAVIASVSAITGNGKEGALSFREVVIKPKKSLETSLKTAVWQKDYLTFNCDSISLQQVNNQALLNDSALDLGYVYLQHPRLSTFRNKNMPFQHGIEKLMPTRLLAGIKIPVQIDSVQIRDGVIDVHEVSVITKREGVVPIKKLNAVLRNITSRPQANDSLLLDASAQVLDYNIRTFRYAESYQDSLSRFNMEYAVSPMQLSHVTAVTNPLSAIAVTRGQADTLYARVWGNKYAAFGEINFIYHNLRIRLLNKDDTLKKSLKLTIKSLLANRLIRSRNRDQDQLFFVRDRERFVFNYWVKTLFSGIVTSTGVKKNRKYKKMYNEAKEKYSLPAAPLP